ncbi:MAG TPA: carbohydrate ABC transporter permease [Spirochaetia bacterium]|nr:carbohydrate ABC transporter permease [Spirochaetia bacterium]
MQRVSNTLWVVATILLLLAVFFPIYWMVAGSLRANIELFKFPPAIFPVTPTLSAYRSILTESDFVVSLTNTIIVAVSTTVLAVGIASLAAYGLSRYRFRGKKLLQYYILLTQMLPAVLLTLPFFAIYSKIGLYDTKLGLVIAYASFTLPFCALSLRGFISSIPETLDEAAKIDGCNSLQAFVRIILPSAQAGLVATGVFAFVNAWNEYLMAVVLSSSLKSKMLVVLIGSKIGQYDIKWNELLAITVIASVPLVVLYSAIQRSFMKGMTAGAVKM